MKKEKDWKKISGAPMDQWENLRRMSQGEYSMNFLFEPTWDGL